MVQKSSLKIECNKPFLSFIRNAAVTCKLISKTYLIIKIIIKIKRKVFVA